MINERPYLLREFDKLNKEIKILKQMGNTRNENDKTIVRETSTRTRNVNSVTMSAKLQDFVQKHCYESSDNHLGRVPKNAKITLHS